MELSDNVKLADLGRLIDGLYAARARRLVAEKKVEAMKREEKDQRDVILRLLREAKLKSASGRKATASPSKVRKYSIGDWKKYWAFARKDATGSYVHKRVASEAIGEWLEAHPGKEVPGLEWMDDVDLSLTKVGAKKGE